MTRASRLEWVPSAFTGINPRRITVRADSSNITNIRTAPNKTFFTSFSSARWSLAATVAHRRSIKCGRHSACDSTRELEKMRPTDLQPTRRTHNVHSDEAARPYKDSPSEPSYS